MMNTTGDANNGTGPGDGFDVIYGYTRAQAIEDGVLVDLSRWARETGFVIPVACTHSVWNGYIVPPKPTEPLGQSERGRAHDLLWMLFCAIRGMLPTQRQHVGGQEVLFFEMIFLMAPGRQETVRLKAVCGPGDEAEPVLTIMQTDED